MAQSKSSIITVGRFFNSSLIISIITLISTTTPSELMTSLAIWQYMLIAIAVISAFIGVYRIGFSKGMRSVKPVVQEVVREIVKEVPIKVEQLNGKNRPISELIYGANEVVTQLMAEYDFDQDRIRRLLQRSENEHFAWHENGPRQARNNFVQLVKAALQKRSSNPRYRVGNPARYADLDAETVDILEGARDDLIAELSKLESKRTSTPISAPGIISSTNF